MSYTNNDPNRLNQASAHDTSLYDPTVHDNQIVAMYDTDAQARAARETLVSSGVEAGSIRLVAANTDSGTLGGTNAEDADSGVWGAIKSMFVPDEDRTAYTHAVGRGHAMLIVTPGSNADRTKIIHALESTDPVDFDAKLEEWRQAGYDTSAPHESYMASGTGMADQRSPTVGVPGPSVTAGTASTAGTSATTGPVAATGAATARPAATGTAPVAPALAGTAGTTGTTGTTDQTLKVMEERMRVGKREVAAGAVRIRSYVVERPVEEQVRLREERVSIERNKVDRAANPADMAAFQERVIEARATSEEAVVSKDARVVEEIGLKKDVIERTETVRDTVRKTEVEVEGDVKGGPAATSGATTSGANTPRR